MPAYSVINSPRSGKSKSGDMSKKPRPKKSVANSKRKCKQCKEYFPAESGFKAPLGWFCSFEHASIFGREKSAQKAIKARKKETRERKKKAETRPQALNRLKTAVHYYVKHVLRRGEPCYTCDKPQDLNNPRAWHVGHYMPAKTYDPRRFMLENLRVQCYSCNAANSGSQREYRKRLIAEKGLEHVEWLECEANHAPLSEWLPDNAAIDKETARWRKMAREATD